MNPDEQDRNPFRRRTSAGSRTGRYLSGRPNFSRQQTPDFFAQAMAQNTPTPSITQKRRINKKPIIIGLIILAIIAVVTVTVVIVVPQINESIANRDKNHDIAELQEVIKQYYPSLIDFEYTIMVAIVNENKLWVPGDEEITTETAQRRNKVAEEMKEFKEKLEKFGGVVAYDYFGKEYDIDRRLKLSIQMLDRHIEPFEKINNIYKFIIDIYVNDGDEAKIDALRNSYDDKELEEIARLIRNYYEARKEYEKISNKKCEDDREACDLGYEKTEKALSAMVSSKALDTLMKRIGNEAKKDEEESLTNVVNEIYGAYRDKETRD